MLGRRDVLTMGAALMASLAWPAQAAITSRPERILALVNTHTGESLRAAYWADGRYQPRALSQINRILRDHRSDQVHPMDPKLLDLLFTLQRRLHPKGPLEIISGYRSPESNELLRRTSDGVATNSLHMRGKAADIRVPRVGVRAVAKLAKSLRAGGVGLYADSNFVHVDVGPVRTW